LLAQREGNWIKGQTEAQRRRETGDADFEQNPPDVSDIFFPLMMNAEVRRESRDSSRHHPDWPAFQTLMEKGSLVGGGLVYKEESLVGCSRSKRQKEDPGIEEAQRS